MKYCYKGVLTLLACILLAACGGGSGGSLGTGSLSTSSYTAKDNKPIAQPDSVIMSQSASALLAILDNDIAIKDTPVTVSIFTQPSHGTVVVNADNTVTYIPNSTYNGSDSFSYMVTDADGDSSTTNVSVSICSGSCNFSMKLDWQPNSEPNLDGYYVYHGVSPGNYKDKIWVGSTTDYTFPSDTNGSHYFAITAVDSDGVESGYSEEVNITL